MGERFATREVDSPIGPLRVAVSEHGVVRVALPRDGGRGFAGWLRERLPDGESVAELPWLEPACRELAEYFDGSRTHFEVSLDLRGTEFQRDVWAALSRIPYGETRTYGDVARDVARPRAMRAVGGANGANPVAVIVPCHRVIAAGGKLGGYGGGLPSKRRLLAFERSRAPEDLV